MAAGDAQPFPIKNKAFRVMFPILDADGDLVTGAASLDSEISKDQGTFADCTNEATEIATASGVYYLDLTAAEMNADGVAIIVKTGTAGAKTTVLTIYPVDLKEPTAVPGYGAGGAGIEEVIAWLLALNRNKFTQTSSTSTLRNDADSGNIATSAISDDGTTLTRAEWS
jgi:hypothetical protein